MGPRVAIGSGLRIPNMLDAAVVGSFRGIYIQGEDIAQSDPNTSHVTNALASMDLVIVQDLFLNETSAYAHVFLPGTSFLEKDGTFTNAERRINRVRPIMASRTGKAEWEVTCDLAKALGYPMHYDDASQIMDEIAQVTPTFAGVSFAKLDELGSIQWPCNTEHPEGTPTMHVGEFTRGEGRFVETPTYRLLSVLPGATRCSSPPVAPSASTTWERKQGAPQMSSGNLRIFSIFMSQMHNCVESQMALGLS